jgi:anti-anti-sigma factor
MLSYSIRHVGAVSVFQCLGNLTLHEEAEFSEKVTDFIFSDHPNLVVDLSGAKSIDVHGIGQLLMAVSQARKIGAVMKLCGLHKLLQDFANDSQRGFGPPLEFYPDPETAIKSFV